MNWLKSILIIVYLVFLLEPNLHAEKSIKQFVKKDYLHFYDSVEASLFDTTQKMDLRKYFLTAIYAKDTITKSLDAEQAYFRLLQYLKVLQEKKINEMKPEKQVKMLYKETHSQFFKKYEGNPVFEDIFKNGNYNCVTATLLYALLFDTLNIDYQIKESAVHVFLVALPGNKSITVESTDPKKGYLVLNESFKNKFVEYLLAQKLVTLSEVSQEGKDAIFDKFYYAQNNISLRQLIALLYYNNGVQFMDNGDYNRALKHFLKSYYLYPSEKSKYLVLSNILNELNKANYTKEEDWRNYVILSNFAGTMISVDNYCDEFLRITNRLLIEKTDTINYNNVYRYINQSVTDTVILKKISYIYHYESGRMYLTNKDYAKAYPHFELAFLLQPDNYQVQNIFVETFTASLQTMQEDTAMAKLEQIMEVYGKSLANTKMFYFLAAAYLYKAQLAFSNQKIKEGDEYLSKFESTYLKYNIGQQFYELIGEVYTKPAALFFKRNNAKKAREYIERGLKLAPGHYRLLNSLKILK
jgi:tetratricopeptide (TPR) repeat protein